MDCASVGKPDPYNPRDCNRGSSSSSSQLVPSVYLYRGLAEIVIAKLVMGRMLLEEVVEVLEIEAY